ncbi:hypothetical protein ALC60_11909 [Trachymyrmex zeteki]|uniref:Uncharacterized protein n=1 Tax=Mycetomoellerius zeteki TaxID=64791 RepID=A0A151WM16_9HYME|nr:hypothetical protein ALC60_11909 [Trachymyrmex zeteki]
MFAVNGNGDHLLAVKFQAVSLLWTPVSGRTLMRHNADRMVNNFFVVANGTFASHAIISRTLGHPRFAPSTAFLQNLIFRKYIFLRHDSCVSSGVASIYYQHVRSLR